MRKRIHDHSGSSDRPEVLLVSGHDSGFSRGAFLGIVRYVRQHTNWKLTCLNPNADRRTASGKRFVGAFLSAPGAGITEWVTGLGIPIVRTGRAPRGEQSISEVSVDEDAVGAMAAEHLADLGLRHFAFAADGDWPFVAYRRDGFVKALERRGMGVVSELRGGSYEYEQGARFKTQLRRMLSKLPRPCGLMTATDHMGMLVVQTCLAMGIRVPEDIAVLGVDDNEAACELSEVPLSSIRQPLSAIGYHAGLLLREHIEHPGRPATRLTLPPERVVARASSDIFAQDDADVATAMRLIRDHATEAINVEWVVRKLTIPRRTLECKFKKAIGRTLLQQIHRERFHRAKELLAGSDLNLDEVARRSGFANARWLIDRFQHELGTTPGRYRAQIRAGS